VALVKKPQIASCAPKVQDATLVRKRKYTAVNATRHGYVMHVNIGKSVAVVYKKYVVSVVRMFET
jgi:hypothetical protein